MPLWPGLDPDDVARLDALASNNQGDRMSFDEAYALISPDAPRDSAETCWNYLVGYYTPQPGETAEPVEP